MTRLTFGSFFRTTEIHTAVNLFGRTRRSDEEDKVMTPGLSVCTSVKILIITEHDYTLALELGFSHKPNT